MLKSLICLFFIIFSPIAGAGLGALMPLLIAFAEQGFRELFTNDPSPSGIGFLLIFTTPLGFISGIGIGVLFAKRLWKSKEGFWYLLKKECLLFYAFSVVGISASSFFLPDLIIKLFYE
jgi:hypothetical protein